MLADIGDADSTDYTDFITSSVEVGAVLGNQDYTDILDVLQ